MKNVRELDRSDYEEQKKVICVGFPWNTKESIDARLRSLCEHSYSFGSFEDEKLASQIIATPYTIDFHNALIPMAGIGFVATLPEFQRQGRIDDVMELLLEKMNEENMVLSYLAPFSYRFYQKFGYEKIFDMIEYSGKIEALPSKKSEDLVCMEMTWEEARPYLRKIAREDPLIEYGQIVREPWWEEYKFHLRKDYTFVICFKDKMPVGYMAYLVKDGIVDVFEIKNKGEEVLLALLDVLKDLEYKEFKFLETEGQSELYRLLDDRPENLLVRVLPGMMARIINVEKFLKMYPFQSSIEFALEITSDRFAPWNTGLYEIHGNKVKRVHETNLITAKMSEGELAKLLFGRLLLIEGRNKIEVKNGTYARMVGMLEKAIVMDPVLFADYF
ncbi:GNAT family N-acetyltransferase [Dubosiella newyorkensis]|uniref:GNAT family N-acetyltransferase n=2 Tax=Dubosiella newyorkensis TaxID=1862672 RepID=UPI0023F23523|nr:GNAT family N-acetyltransferase [Dubosiella newyorkensis]